MTFNRAKRGGVTRALFFVLGVAGTLGAGGGCSDAFNPAFLNLFAFSEDGSGAGSINAITPPPGHIPLIFRNTAKISDDVFRFLIQNDAIPNPEVVEELQRVNPQMTTDQITTLIQNIINDVPVNLEGINLPPRVRLTVDVVNVNGGVQRLEFLDGLRLVRGENLVGTGGSLTSLPPALTQNTNSIFIVQCDIAAIQIVSIEVFNPVLTRVVQIITQTTGGTTTTFERCTASPFIPTFWRLLADQGFSTTTGTFSVLRNYDPRNFPPPITSLRCGAVVVLELTGDLTLPFITIPEGCAPLTNPPSDNRAPGFFQTSQDLLRIPGRYAMSLRVRDQ